MQSPRKGALLLLAPLILFFFIRTASRCLRRRPKLDDGHAGGIKEQHHLLVSLVCRLKNESLRKFDVLVAGVLQVLLDFLRLFQLGDVFLRVDGVIDSVCARDETTARTVAIMY